MTQYHVSAQAAKTNGAGSAADPFLTIGQAAAIARAGDEVVVHAGTYRESVDPRFGGESATNRIVYRAAAGEPRPVITGSERIDTWQPEGDGVWKAVIPNAFFNGYNPYVETVFGDWTVYPDPKVEVRHLGDVYLNGKSFYEVSSLDKVRNPQRWDTGRDAATDSIVPLIDPDATVNVWCCAVDDEATTIWANFHEADPNAELTEINVRETCFYPSRPFVNYITVSGFEMAQAACPYTPPTADQVGLVGPHWSRGWVIENNRIHDAKCSAISLGKEISTGDNESTRTHRKSGYQYQKEAVYKALHAGWEKGVVGGHVVRGNVIYDCGQNGVVGVGAGLGNDLHSFLKLNAPLPQQPDQLRDDHAGVGVVDLDGGVVCQIMEVAAPGGALGQNELCTGRNHQVLLVHSQTAAGLVGIIRVEEEGQVLINSGLVEGNAVMDDALINGIKVEQVQGVGASLVAGNGQLVQPGGVLLARQFHRVGGVGLFRPAVGSQPRVGLFVLHTILKRLVEQAKVIPQAHAVAGQVQRCQRIQEAGCQTAQTTVAERRLRFHFLNIGKTLSGSGQCIPGFFVQPQIDEVVRQQLANEKFGADIVQLAAGNGLHAVGTLLPHQLQQCQIQLLIGAVRQQLSGEAL